MSDTPQSDRTEEATPKKRQETAKKGQIPRSREVMTAMLLVASALAVGAGGPGLASSVTELFMVSATAPPIATLGADQAAGYIGMIGQMALWALMPIPLALAGVAVLVGGIQARGIITPEPLKPQLNRLDPINKAKQIWGMQAMAEFLKSLLKLSIVGLAVWMTLRGAVYELLLIGQTTPAALLDFMSRYAVRLLLTVGGAYTALALADYAFQIWQHERRIRMTREEVKRELKDSEGDQVVKVRRRTIARQLAHKRMMQDVTEADVVVTNPTHIAVALKYDPDVAHAPIVLAMGERLIAQKIKEVAREAEVPVVENKPLARALFATAKVGETVPMDLFVAVAEILAFVYRMQGRGAGYGSRR